jgi:hypothetical protein
MGQLALILHFMVLGLCDQNEKGQMGKNNFSFILLILMLNMANITTPALSLKTQGIQKVTASLSKGG